MVAIDAINPRATGVRSDYAPGGGLSAEELIGMGHRQTGLHWPPFERLGIVRKRYDVLRFALAAAGIEWRRSLTTGGLVGAGR